MATESDTKLETKIIDEENSLLKIIIPSKYSVNQNYLFSDSYIREELNKFFNINETFNFLRTVGNPELDKLLRESEKYLRSKGYHQFKGSRYHADIRDMFLKYIHNVTKNHIYYPLIENKDVHNSERHVEEFLWPVVHVIKGDNNAVNKFKNNLKNLLSEDAYNFIKKKEAPQNYDMPMYDLIFDKKVYNLIFDKKLSPFILESKIWTVDGKVLKDAVDFLVPHEYKYESKNHSFSDD